jgi:hypothetical protein
VVQPTGKRSFRDTLWFKMGASDAAARVTSVTGDAAPTTGAATDLLPVEDRYLDDGSVTRDDSALFSVRTGTTQALPRMTTAPAEPRPAAQLDALVRELTWSRRRIAVIGACVAAAGVFIAVCVT